MTQEQKLALAAEMDAANLNYIGEENYIGEMGFDFGGAPAKNFAFERDTDRDFTFTVDNKTAATPIARTIALNPGQFLTEARLAAVGYTQVAGILKDGGVIPGAAAGVQLTATADNPVFPINEYLEWVRRNPARIVGMTIDADDPNAFRTKINVYQWDPFKNKGTDKIIDIYKYYNEFQQSQKKITVDLLKKNQDFQMDDQSIVTLLVNAGRTMTITLHHGAINNQAAKLSAGAKAAKGNLTKLARLHGAR